MRNHKISVKITSQSYILVIGEPCELILKNTAANRKVIVIICKLLQMAGGVKTGLTFNEISIFFGYTKRQWSNNFFREFKECGEDFFDFLKRERNIKEKSFALVEKFFLDEPLFCIMELYRQFKTKFPKISISYSTFINYINQVETGKVIKKFKQLYTTGKISVNIEYCLRELLKIHEIGRGDRKKIVEYLPEIKKVETSPSINPVLPETRKNILVAFLFSSGLNQKTLAILFGVSKKTIHNWLHKLGTESLVETIIKSVRCWSGQIGVDEKWIKIAGVWHYVFSAVDQKTGFPLWIRLFPKADKDNWATFFKQIKIIYGIPRLIVSDGGNALLGGKNMIFPKVVHQLCKFHKLKNLFKLLYKEINDLNKREKALKLAKYIFSKTWISNRKRAAFTLSSITNEAVGHYIEKHILECWRKLSKSFTNNAAERCNRVIEKCVKGRYGLKNEKSANMILKTLWLKELLLNGKKHLSDTSQFNDLDLTKICQENFNYIKIDHFISNSALGELEIAA